jgi:subtilisin family serine protease
MASSESSPRVAVIPAQRGEPIPGAQQFVLLPPRGLSIRGGASTPSLQSFLLGLSPGMTTQQMTMMPSNIEMRVLDAIHENGAKLVELRPESLADLRATQPGLKIVPVVYYQLAIAPRPVIASAHVAGSVLPTPALSIRIVSGAPDKSPISGATVVAFTDFAMKIGAQGITDSSGYVNLALGLQSVKIERLYVYPRTTWWPMLRLNVEISSGTEIPLSPIDLAYKDVTRSVYDVPVTEAYGKGVRVAVVDSGIAAHPDLVISGGMNAVPGENATDYGDNGVGHGTHVAGIIAARGIPPKGIRGLAPEVDLRSYRVCPQGSRDVSNYSIAKAIDHAIADGCDLINMSLGGGTPDTVVEQAIDDARLAGAVVICAAGNGYRSPVSFPASYTYSIAVSAFGREGTFPAGAAQEGSVQRPPFGTNAKDFIADFSNVGPEIDLTGPGVGVISTFPGGYAVLDGTSMACPAVTGAAARILGQTAAILNSTRDQSRSDQIQQLIGSKAASLGFGPTFEGKGYIKA